ncbi:hypothetical protein [Thioalkalivibrio sp. ALE27]|uniref:hypothetical protein n=1 Tax=Thioalkalivibrio sp. ALE27 TaxID=1158178 RepID=UPI0012DCBFF4|nr:hypothetical protein [Thioalkalivibrio sp. ALE27]
MSPKSYGKPSWVSSSLLTESERLARAIGETDLHRIDGFSHIDPQGVGLIGQWQRVRAMMDLLARRSD